MGPVTIAFGLVMILIGAGGYFAAGLPRSWTALIPAIFGVVFIILGVPARDEKLRKHVMHLAAGLALLGAVMSGMRAVPGLVKLSAGEEINRVAVASTTAMMGVCVIFLILCGRSFIAARRARQA